MGDMDIAVGIGAIPGWTPFRKFGINPDLSGTEDVWGQGGIRVLPTSAANAVVTSTSPEDDENEATPPGTGAFEVELRGLDADYNELSEVITLQGTTNVNSVNEYLRVDRMFVRECGSNGTNVGNITATVGGNIQANILANQGQTAVAMYTVPAGKTFLINYFEVGVGRLSNTTSDCNVRGQIRLYNENVGAASNHEGWRTISNLYLYTGQEHSNSKSVTLLPEKTDIRIQVSLTAGSTQAEGVFGGYLIDNTTQGNFG